MELWLILAILAFTSYATSISIDKYLMSHKYGILRTNTLKMFFDGAILLIIGLLFFDLNFSSNVLFWSIPLGIIYSLAGIVYFTALKLKDVEQVIPTWQSLGILLLFIFSIIIFNEFVTLFNYLGVALILVGVYMILSKTGFQMPVLDKGFCIILAVVFLDVTYALLVKYLVSSISPITLAIMMYFVATLVLVVYNFSFNKKVKIIDSTSKTLKILVAAFFGAMGTLLIYSALSIGNASKIYPISGLQCVFIFIIASIFLKEKFYLHRLAGTIAVVFGIFLVSI
ncbi:MAG: DMT family transporter [Candidatus Woesearchaeota archaeon]|nr:MAG: DMT family transporter [Candidatus Woesearchaeota archaeon]